MKQIKQNIITVVVFNMFLMSCVEPIKLETQTYEEALVIECTLTDQVKQQLVKLSLVSLLENNESISLTDAQVLVEDSQGAQYTFSEHDDGSYLSDNEFEAVPNVEYKLFITTSKGKEYESRGEFLTPKVPIDRLYGKLETIHNIKGVQVYVDCDNVNESANFFRYEFEETYKILTPYEITHDLMLTDITTGEFTTSYTINIVPLEEDIHVCYSSAKQTKIIQTNISGSAENNINQSPIRFIEETESIIRDRYSILVNQYTQTYDSYNFYRILSKLGNIGNVLEENQTGFVKGNVYSKNDEKETVVGFFDVSSVSSKRIYFNYKDFDLTKPKYPYTCYEDILDYMDNTEMDQDRNDRIYLYEIFHLNKPPWSFSHVEADPNPKYVIISPECGDCTAFSSTLKPEFWQD